MKTTNTIEGVAGGEGPSPEKTRLRALALAAQLRVHGLADRASRSAEDSAATALSVRYAAVAARAAVAAFKLAE